MSLKINAIHNHGDAKEEYIFLQATADIDLKNYAVVDRTFDKAGNLSNIHRHYYRFPSKLVKKGDYVSLRTSVGKPELGKAEDGKPIHRFYWGSKTAIWNDDDTEKAELLRVVTLESKAVPASK